MDRGVDEFWIQLRSSSPVASNVAPLLCMSFGCLSFGLELDE
jgi:hypothetical protein